MRKSLKVAAVGLVAALALQAGLAGIAFADDPDDAEEIAEAAQAAVPAASLDYLSAPTSAALSATEALYAWGACDKVVLVPSDCGALLMCAAALAGAYDCPVVTIDAAPDADAMAALATLGVRNAYIVAQPLFDTKPTMDALAAQGAVSTVFQKDSASETSTYMVRYGQERNLWRAGQMLVANSADAAAASPSELFFYHEKSPVLLTELDGMLSDEQCAWLASSGVLRNIGAVTAVGSPGAVSDGVFAFAGFSHSLTSSLLTRRIEGDVAALEAATSALSPVVSDTLILTDTTLPSYPTMRLAAARKGMRVQPIQGTDAYQTVIDCFDANVTHLLFVYAGEEPFDQDQKDRLSAVIDRINLTGQMGTLEGSTITYWNTGLSLADAAAKQVGLSVNDAWQQIGADEIATYMDPAKTPAGTTGFCQFLDLSGGYTGLITSSQIDAFIESYIPAIERSTGYTSPFHGMGATIIQAARAYNINEVYLLAHAIIECGAGCSNISTLGGYYNFYGIAAYDTNPYASGDFAKGQGWKTAEEAIMGGAKWISEHYVNSETYHQNTLYQMRWCVPGANHEYCSACSFPVKVGAMIEKIYAFAGVDVTDAGLTFSIPVYH